MHDLVLGAMRELFEKFCENGFLQGQGRGNRTTKKVLYSQGEKC